MGKIVKYVIIAGGGGVLLLFAALLIIPRFINVEQFKPRIEELITSKTGYPLTIAGDITLSLFPWVGVNLANVTLENPEHFDEKTFLSIKNFQAKMNVMPLLSKKVEIDRFILEHPQLVLTRNKKGLWNWQPEDKTVSKQTKTTPESPDNTQTGETESSGTERQISIESLLVGECAIKNGTITINDLVSETTRNITDINLSLQDVSFDKPVTLTMQAKLADKPIDLKALIGPLSSDPLNSRVNVDIELKLFNTLAFNSTGYLENMAAALSYTFDFNLTPFNPKSLFTQIGLELPIVPSDPEALEKLAAQGTISGSKSEINVSESKIILDDSTIAAVLNVKEFSKPDITFDLSMDTIDVDRYLPAGEKNQGAPSAAKEASAAPSTERQDHQAESPINQGAASADSESSTARKDRRTDQPPARKRPEDNVPDFTQLKKIVVTGQLAIDSILVHGGTISNLTMSLSGENGLFKLTSLESDLYQGGIRSTGQVDLRSPAPVSSINLAIKNVQAGPLLRDFADKNIIEGALQADIHLTTAGLDPEDIKKSLDGKGDLLFEDGAIIGIDLAQLARTIKSGFTLTQQADRPKTDFAEFHAPFTIANGVVTIEESDLKSPFIRVQGHGTTDLVNETIDLRLTPKVVGTIKGQGDEETRSGIAVPIIVGGTFEKPTFRPDLEQLVKEQNIDEEEIAEIIKTGEISQERKEQLNEELGKAKSLLKGLFGN